MSSPSPELSLNFLGEIVKIEFPKNLFELRQKISEKYVFKKSDVDELILSYSKESKNINIESEDDYKNFLDTKINHIQIDIGQNNSSHIYKDNLSKLKEEKTNEEKKLNELLKQNEEYKKLLSTKFISQKQEIIDISKQIQELFSKRKKLIQYIKIEKAKIIKMKKNNDKAIAELEKKLGLKSSRQNRAENDIIKYKKMKNKKLKDFNREKIKKSQKTRTISLEKRQNSPMLPSSEISAQSLNKINFNKINLKRKLSPMPNYTTKEKKLFNINDNKNNINPFYDETEENKSQKKKFEKIAEIICNNMKNKNDISNEKIKNTKIPFTYSNKIKEKKEKAEDNNELDKNQSKNYLKKRFHKYEQLLSTSKEKSQNSIKKMEDNKNENKIKIYMRNNPNKKIESHKNTKK